jgi:hypothetical protein
MQCDIGFENEDKKAGGAPSAFDLTTPLQRKSH